VGEAGGDERRLLQLGLDHLLERRVEAKLCEVKTRGIARDVEHLPRLRLGLHEVPAHTGLERALAGEAERDLSGAHAAISSVHSITPDPHVSPAPIPVISTMSPF